MNRVIGVDFLLDKKKMDRFKISTSDNLENHWCSVDTENGIICVFENKKFHETQQYSFYEDVEVDASKIARLANEMTAWLILNHSDKI